MAEKLGKMSFKKLTSHEKMKIDKNLLKEPFEEKMLHSSPDWNLMVFKMNSDFLGQCEVKAKFRISGRAEINYILPRNKTETKPQK